MSPVHQHGGIARYFMVSNKNYDSSIGYLRTNIPKGYALMVTAKPTVAMDPTPEALQSSFHLALLHIIVQLRTHKATPVARLFHSTILVECHPYQL